MIIVEGADNCGKTTLIQQLLDADPSLHLLKRRRFKPGEGETIASSYLNMLVPADGDYQHHARGVADRCLASECIYGNLFRGGCRISDRDHFAIKSMLMSYGTLVVHCDVSDDEIRRTWAEREQLYDHDPLLIARAYRRNIRALFSPLPVFVYRWTDANADAQRRQIVVAHQRILYGFRSCTTNEQLSRLTSCRTRP